MMEVYSIVLTYCLVRCLQFTFLFVLWSLITDHLFPYCTVQKLVLFELHLLCIHSVLPCVVVHYLGVNTFLVGHSSANLCEI